MRRQRIHVLRDGRAAPRYEVLEMACWSDGLTVDGVSAGS